MSATAKKRPNPDPSTESRLSKHHVCGPADHQFSSALEAAEYYLDAYWQGWRTDRAFVVPTIFKWKNPDVSDAAIMHTAENLPERENKQYDQVRRVFTDDQSCAGEHIVFQAFERLVRDQIGSPFMAVHGLKISMEEKSSAFISKLLPVTQEMQRVFINAKKSGNSTSAEFDFVIVGPKVGILAIEVKSSEFTQGRNFDPKSTNLPDHFYKGFEQLEKADLLSRVFQECMPDSYPEEFLVRKILFLPNLDKGRYESWLGNLAVIKPEAHGRVINSIGDIILWFKEDMTSSSGVQDTPLYRKILEFLSDPSQLNPLSQTAYETCVKVLMALKSMTRPREKLELDQEILSPLEAILKENRRIQEQNPRNIAEKVVAANLKKQLHDKSGLTAPEKPLKSSVFFLSKAQLDVLNGPNRQLIIGAAGTGKTVVLQEKILELLEGGQTVMIMAQENFRGVYKKILEEHGYENRRHYRIKTWSFARRVDKNFELEKRLLYYAWEQREYASIAAMLRIRLGENQRRRDETDNFLNNVISRIVHFTQNNATGWRGTIAGMLVRKFCRLILKVARNGNLIKWITSLLPGQQGRNEVTTEGEDNDLEVLCSFCQRAARALIRDLKSAFPWMHECDHIFIDDFSDAENSQLRYPYTFVVGVVLFIEAARAINPNMVVWAALDAYKGKSLESYEEFLSQVRRSLRLVQYSRDEDGREYERFSTVVLKQVMRCSIQIFNHCYADGEAIETWEDDLRPEAGHKILGMLPISKQSSFSTKEEAQETFWQEISKIVKYLIDLGCNYEHFAIVIGHEREEDDDLYKFLTDQCQQMETHRSDWIDWMQVMGQMRMWSDVSSLEWPIVIYGNVLSQDAGTKEARDYIGYLRYRGQTRAKVFLVNYDYTYTQYTDPKTRVAMCMGAQVDTAKQMDLD